MQWKLKNYFMEKLLRSLLYWEQNKNYHLLHLTIYWESMLSLFLNLYEPKENAVEKCLLL